MKFGEFKEIVKTNYNEIFPKSACSISLGALGGDSAFVTYYLAGDQSEFPNKIAQNDLFQISFHIMQQTKSYGDGIKLEDDTELPETLVLDVNHKTIMTKPDNDYMAYGSISLPFRRTAGTPEKIIDTLKRYAEIVKKTLTELYEEEALPVNQKPNIVEFVADKLGINETKKTEGLEITGTWEPHPEIGKSYAYRVKHGLGGGTLPNDVKIKKYEELNNGWVIVYLDRPLTAKELDFYDIPSETISMPEIDKFIDYKCMKGESKLQEEDEVELQDVDSEYTIDREEEPYGELQDVLDDFKNIDGFHEFVVDDLIDSSVDYEDNLLINRLKNRCDSVLSSGCVSGIVGSLVYYSDTVKVFDEYADDIYDLIDDYGPDEFLDVLKAHVNTTEIILNCDTAKNWIVWIAYEDLVYQLSNILEGL